MDLHINLNVNVTFTGPLPVEVAFSRHPRGWVSPEDQALLAAILARMKRTTQKLEALDRRTP